MHHIRIVDTIYTRTPFLGKSLELSVVRSLLASCRCTKFSRIRINYRLFQYMCALRIVRLYALRDAKIMCTMMGTKYAKNDGNYQ